MAQFVANKDTNTQPLRLTESLKKALALLPEYEQDRLAQCLLDWMAKDEGNWESALAQSGDKLKKLGDEALQDFLAGKTRPLDPEKL